MFRLLQHSDSSGEELIQQRRISQSKPGYNDDWHCDLLTVAAATIDLIDPDYLCDREYQYRPGLAGRRRRRLPVSVAVTSRRPHRSRVGSVPARAAQWRWRLGGRRPRDSGSLNHSLSAANDPSAGLPAGWETWITTPVLVVLVSMSLRAIGALSSGNSRLPLPRTRG